MVLLPAIESGREKSSLAGRRIPGIRNGASARNPPLDVELAGLARPPCQRPSPNCWERAFPALGLPRASMHDVLMKQAWQLIPCLYQDKVLLLYIDLNPLTAVHILHLDDLALGSALDLVNDIVKVNVL